MDVPSGLVGGVEADAEGEADRSAADAGCPPWAIATAEGVDVDAIDDCGLLRGGPLGEVLQVRLVAAPVRVQSGEQRTNAGLTSRLVAADEIGSFFRTGDSSGVNWKRS